MNATSIVLRILAGMALGVFFYFGLWLTVRGLPGSRHPVLLTLGSFWIRTVLVLAGVLYLMQGRWQFAVACMTGFLMGRLAVSLPLRVREAGVKCP